MKDKIKKFLPLVCIALLFLIFVLRVKNPGGSAGNGASQQPVSQDGGVTVFDVGSGGQSSSLPASSGGGLTVFEAEENDAPASEDVELPPDLSAAAPAAAAGTVTVFDSAEESVTTAISDESSALLDIISDSTAPPSSKPEASAAAVPSAAAEHSSTAKVKENGLYTSRDDVALYIHLYGHLPDNFITKAEARALGWGEEYSSVDDAAPGKSIGGDRFGNREGLLPKKSGRSYTECDIGTMGKKSRGAKRIVFSNDGLVYYTGDHYETFELLYGKE